MATKIPENFTDDSTILELGAIPVQALGMGDRIFLPVEFKVSDADTDPSYNYYITVKDIVGLITKDSLGLGKVDNTADADKPISQKTQEALDEKLGKTESIPTNQVDGLVDEILKHIKQQPKVKLGEVEGLSEFLEAKADTDHKHSIDDTNGLREVLNELAPANHSHSLTGLDGWTQFRNDLTITLNNKADEAKVNEIVNQKVDTGFIKVGANAWA